MTVTVLWQSSATQSVLVDKSQSVLFNRAMNLSSELARELIHVLYVISV